MATESARKVPKKCRFFGVSSPSKPKRKKVKTRVPDFGDAKRKNLKGILCVGTEETCQRHFLPMEKRSSNIIAKYVTMERVINLIGVNTSPHGNTLGNRKATKETHFVPAPR